MNGFVYENGRAFFVLGDCAEEAAASIAGSCSSFSRDYEEECFYDDDVTCYNCRYRRWNRDGFECMKGGCR